MHFDFSDPELESLYAKGPRKRKGVNLRRFETFLTRVRQIEAATNERDLIHGPGHYERLRHRSGQASLRLTKADRLIFTLAQDDAGIRATIHSIENYHRSA